MKLAITIALDAAGKPDILAGPNADIDGQVEALRKLTDKSGKIGKAQYVEAVILHTVKGPIKRRKF